MNYQHFFIVGGQRCGSTMLARALDHHPNIEMNHPLYPEPKYFLKESVDLPTYIRTYFYRQKGTELLGEKSTTYCESKTAARNISKHLPSAKIIFILRNPVYRALSNYFFSCQNGLESRTLREVFIQGQPKPAHTQPISTDPFAYLQRGKYADHIKLYQHFFSADQIFVVILEEVVRGFQLNEMLKFLGLDPTNEIDKWIRPDNELDWKRRDIPVEVIEYLFKYYSDELENLESLLKRPLDIWKK